MSPPLSILTNLKICSSRPAYKNRLYVSQRFITAFQNWKTANAMYIADEDPKMSSENQPTNLSKSLTFYLTFLKEHFVFQKISPGLPMDRPAILDSRSPEPQLLLLVRDDSSPYGSLHSMNFYFPYYLNYIVLSSNCLGCT